MNVEAVIFDLDDTLVVEEAVARGSLRAAARLVPEVSPEHFEQVVLGCARRAWHSGPYRQLCLELGIASWEGLWARFEGCHPRLDGLRDWAPAYRQEAWQAAVVELGLDRPGLAPALAAAYEEAQRAGHPLIDGADQVVRAAVGRYRLGLLTNGPADIQRLKLDQTGLADCFGAVVISGQAGVGKPDPEAFRLVLAALGASPAEAVMVGDSWSRDVQGALGAGMRAMWLAGDRPTPEAAPEVRVLSSISELGPALVDAVAPA